ncbi:type VI secretion system-associated FHA domain protein TagH [Devosia nitrariae]|uniref:Type VI secretion protein n=1 Tax=Devosia nitrariae TaxID=2071872 RepID=A0ABQ5WDS1_9HYPH|nr:type VI secretion system-associated FHA domain protein TagH [Devosia nitrariae]GLQ58038.1 type VI secretion protein [Devosia nitrariae]
MVAIVLRIENFDRLSDGGPLEFSAGPRGFDIGREQHLDWCLPDPERFISGHHCQVRYENGAYWLNDISTNGTFVNGSSQRVKSPYRLAHGDRLQIGDYIISVALPDEAGSQPLPQQTAAASAPPAGGDIWSLEDEPAVESVDRRWFNEPSRREHRPAAPDALEEFVDFRAAPPAQPASDASPFGSARGALRDVPGSRIPEQAPQPAPVRAAPIQNGGAATAARPDAVLAALCAAAGLPANALEGRQPEEAAAEIGAVLMLVTSQLMELLQARAAAKQMTKSGDRTMIGLANNNPMKFVPDPAEALQIMFQRSKPGYLDAPASFTEGFEDIKRHEYATYAAMQKALARLMEDLAPDAIEDKVGSFSLGSKKSRAWDVYVERWNAKTAHHENGILDVFLRYFADAYDAAAKKR